MAQPVPRAGGHILADQLQKLGAKAVFCVPGESFLDLLDGLHTHQDSIQTIVCRQEGAAANMADAYAKMTGQPGICAVTRGPGATNAANGIHTAFQDSTPMIVLIGQVGRSMMDREAFQEMDYRRVFGQMAKWVAEINDPARLPEYLSRAWKTAMSGRPGPVVLALPEDMLKEVASVTDAVPRPLQQPAPDPAAMAALGGLLAKAKKPLMLLGGPGWSAKVATEAERLATRLGLPVATSFRCQDYFDNDHPNYVGVLGIAPLPELRKRIAEEVDLLIVIGSRLGEMTTQGYTLLNIPDPQMDFVHVHPGAADLGHVYNPHLAIQSGAATFFQAATALPDGDGTSRWADWVKEQRADYEAFLAPTKVPGGLNMGEVVAHVAQEMPHDTVITNGAGNYTVWPHRFHRHRAYRTQLAPTSGSMGYGVPAALAAKVASPDRPVISYSGDGCFLMCAQELATARLYDLDVIYIVVNNGMLGTIRMHQERHYPDRKMATDLFNPDFVAYAASFGIAGERVDRTEDFPAALARAKVSKGGYLIELVVDQQALTPTQTLAEATAQGQATRAKKGPV